MARNKKPYVAKLINGMYSTKPSRTKPINTYGSNSLRKRVEFMVERVNKRLSRLDKGIDTYKATRSGNIIDRRTGRILKRSRSKFTRKGTITFVSDSGKRVRLKQKHIVDYRGSFASKKLGVLDQYNEEQNRIYLTGNESYQELIMLDKATKNFLNSKTSTISGIQEVEKTIKQNIANKLDDEFDLSKDEVETLYTFFEDDDFAYIRKYVDPSDLWVFMESAKENNVMVQDWLKTIEDYIGSEPFGKDKDLEDKLISLYNKIMGFNDLL